jgi:hypothetical protein
MRDSLRRDPIRALVSKREFKSKGLISRPDEPGERPSWSSSAPSELSSLNLAYHRESRAFTRMLNLVCSRLETSPRKVMLI